MAATQLDHRLRTFACALKKDNIGIDEFSNVFNDYVFKVYPVVPFKIDMIYRRDNLVAKELVLFNSFKSKIIIGFLETGTKTSKQ